MATPNRNPSSPQASVQTRHVAILIAILLTILVAILVLLPLFILKSPNSSSETGESNTLKSKDHTDKGGSTRELIGGLSVGSIIIIKGRVNRNPKRFDIGLMMRDGNSIALNLSPRFNWKGDVNVFARNSLLSGSWGVEERQIKSFSFRPDDDFQIRISCFVDAFHVTVNNNDQLEYKYRVGLNKITHVKVSGDMTLVDVSKN
ncbi:galectin-8-like [Syngnathus scovelli]|uniref:galectin-8-like n=1 Tax=Syngnathus scovelli TaxID=161590 RepID=UPI00210F55E7|nr:galectin-8-like [Syngnathus scovelli]